MGVSWPPVTQDATGHIMNYVRRRGLVDLPGDIIRPVYPYNRSNA